MGVAVPSDRTQMQPVRCFCRNQECYSPPQERFEFEIEHGDVVCPKCGANQSPMVGTLAIVHFMVRDNMGPLSGCGGLRYRLACEPNRHYIATNTNQEAGTGDLHVVSCIRCLAVAREQKLSASQGSRIEN